MIRLSRSLSLLTTRNSISPFRSSKTAGFQAVRACDGMYGSKLAYLLWKRYYPGIRPLASTWRHRLIMGEFGLFGRRSGTRLFGSCALRDEGILRAVGWMGLRLGLVHRYRLLTLQVRSHRSSALLVFMEVDPAKTVFFVAGDANDLATRTLTHWPLPECQIPAIIRNCHLIARHSLLQPKSALTPVPKGYGRTGSSRSTIVAIRANPFPAQKKQPFDSRPDDLVMAQTREAIMTRYTELQRRTDTESDNQLDVMESIAFADKGTWATTFAR